MRSLSKSRTAASFVLACLIGSPQFVLAQVLPAPETPAPTPTENTLPSPNAAPVPANDTYIRLPGAAVREDPLMERYRQTSRGLAQTDRGETVTQRKRVGYDPQGIPLSSFTLFPALTTSATATNNVFRQSNEQADAFVTGRLESALRSDWGRHALSFDGMLEKDLHAEYSTENNFNYRARASGRFDIFEADRLSFEAVHERTTQDRGNTGDILVTRKPISNDHTGVELGGRIGGRRRIQAQLEAAYDLRQFHLAETVDGIALNQQFRNFDDYRVTGQLGYKLGAQTALFVSGAHTWRRFPNQGIINRNVNVIEILGGIEGNITPVIRGRLGLGYISANFKTAAIPNQHGLGVDARLDFLVTELTTVRLSARRDLRNVAGANSSAAFGTFGRIGVDHELFRNVIVSPAASYEVSDYVGSDRLAKLLSLEMGGRWLINRRLRMNALAELRNRSARGFDTGRNYTAASFTAGLTFQL